MALIETLIRDVVNEAFARQHWPGEEPIGKRLTFRFYNNDGLSCAARSSSFCWAWR